MSNYTNYISIIRPFRRYENFDPEQNGQRVDRIASRGRKGMLK